MSNIDDNFPNMILMIVNRGCKIDNHNVFALFPTKKKKNALPIITVSFCMKIESNFI